MIVLTGGSIVDPFQDIACAHVNSSYDCVFERTVFVVVAMTISPDARNQIF